jgi:PleD family two-component response regulator
MAEVKKKKITTAKPKRKEQKLKVLLIDDDDFLAKILADKLAQSGFEPVLARDGESGLRAVKAKKPVAVLLDVLLPKMDGFKVLERLKSSAATRNIPVIMLTNLAKKEDLDRAKELGALDYLMKAHLAPDDMIERLRKAINER